jgi:hypothetical protein
MSATATSPDALKQDVFLVGMHVHIRRKILIKSIHPHVYIAQSCTDLLDLFHLGARRHNTSESKIFFRAFFRLYTHFIESRENANAINK